MQEVTTGMREHGIDRQGRMEKENERENTVHTDS